VLVPSFTSQYVRPLCVPFVAVTSSPAASISSAAGTFGTSRSSGMTPA
jgi:hypothetical protein